jgi:hypothetical protein
LLLKDDEGLIQGNSGAFPSTLGRAAAPGVVDQHLPHGLGRGGEEVAAVGDLGQGVAVEEAQQSLVDQGTGLEGMAGSLVVHQSAGDPPQLAVDGGDEAIPGVGAAGAGLVEEDRQLPCSPGAHRSSINSQKLVEVSGRYSRTAL